MRQQFYLILAPLALLTFVVQCVRNPPPNPNPWPTAQELLVPDPARKITCPGAHSDIGWNIDLNWGGGRRYDGRSMQELCAHPLYGGKNDNLNFGGFCNEGDVIFLELPGQALRSVLECRTRCFCNHGLPNPTQQPFAVALTRKTFDPRRINNNGMGIPLDNRGATRSRTVHALTRLYKVRDPPPNQFWPARWYNDLGVLPSNEIVCQGPLPTF